MTQGNMRTLGVRQHEKYTRRRDRKMINRDEKVSNGMAQK
jgi:hypothetical protein